MAEKIKENQFDEVGVNPFNAPVPGESLTASPDTPKSLKLIPIIHLPLLFLQLLLL